MTSSRTCFRSHSHISHEKFPPIISHEKFPPIGGFLFFFFFLGQGSFLRSIKSIEKFDGVWCGSVEFWSNFITVYTAQNRKENQPCNVPALDHLSLITCRAAKGCSRNYPRGGTGFSRPLHPQDKHGVRAPQPPGHLSALINPPHYRSNTCWPPRQVAPTPRTHCQQNTPPPHRTKKCLWPARIISGTALKHTVYGHYRLHQVGLGVGQG